MSAISERLRAARAKAGFGSAREAARAFGWNENTYKSHEFGARGVPIESAKRYARAFRVSAAWLLTGEGDALARARRDVAVSPAKGSRTIRKRASAASGGEASTRDSIPAKQDVAVVGYVSAGQQITQVDDQPSPRGLGRVEAPAGLGEVSALIVRGDSLWPRYNSGDVIFFGPRHENPRQLIGQECVVRLGDGRMYVKTLHRGSRARLFTLMSHNAPPMEDQSIAWAAPITWVERSGERA